MKLDDKARMTEGDIDDAYKAFGFVRGGAGLKPFNLRHGVTHATFAASDYLFRKACAIAGVEPTKAQAAKWRNKRGAAYKHKGTAQNAL
jgi:hypothetical protein